MRLGALAGTLTLEGDLASLIPLLIAAEILHAGKKASSASESRGGPGDYATERPKKDHRDSRDDRT